MRLVFEYGVKRGDFWLDRKCPMGLPPLRYLDDGTDLDQAWEMIEANFVRNRSQFGTQYIMNGKSLKNVGIMSPTVTGSIW